MKMKLAIGTKVLKKRACSSLSTPPRRGEIIDYVEKTNKRGSRLYYYLVKLDGTDRTEEWAPAIACPVDSKESTVAFAF